MNEFRFLDWSVYKNSKETIKEIYSITNKFPSNFKYNLGGQLNKPATPVALNIAEGSGKIQTKN